MRASFRARPMAPSRGDRPTVGREGAPTAISPVFLRLLADEDLAGRTVLDVGTGRGRLALALAPRSGRVVGIDRDEVALTDARRAGGRGVPRRAPVGGARRAGVRLRGGGAGGGDRAGGEVARRRPLVPLQQVPRGGRPHAHARAPARTSEEGVTLVGLALAQAVKARALELGFDRVAIGPARLAHGAAFERWLDDGCAGTMDYLQETRAERLDPARVLPGCRSVIAVA